MNIAVLIASHINYKGQIKLLEKCLNSLLNQTYKVDILLSISFLNETYKKHFNLIIKKKFTSLIYNIEKQQKYQLEHFYNLSKKTDKYDYILFIDDDDTYNLDRVELIINHINKNNGLDIYKEIGDDVKEYIENGKKIIKSSKDYNEYWSFIIKPYILNDFFKLFIDDYDLFKNKFADVIFRKYLMLKVDLLNDKSRITISSYNYYKDNINSVCSTKETNEIEKLKTNLYLGIIYNKNELILEEEDFLKHIFNNPSFKLTEDKIRDLLPCYDRLKKVLSKIDDINKNSKYEIKEEADLKEIF